MGKKSTEGACSALINLYDIKFEAIENKKFYVTEMISMICCNSWALFTADSMTTVTRIVDQN